MDVKTQAGTLPHWDMTVVYPSLASPEFEEGLRAAIASIDRLVALFDEHHVGAGAPGTLDGATIRAFDGVVEAYNQVLADVRTLRAYIAGFVATDSRDELAQVKRSELEQHAVKLSMLNSRFTAWVGSLDIEALIGRSAVAREHAFLLRKSKERAAHLMSPPEEALAAELDLTGSAAWAKLHHNFTSQLLVPIELDGARQALPMSEIRNLAFDPDREVRRRGYEAELATWKQAALPLAAALNSIKGEMNTLSRRRQWDSPLEVALFINTIDRQTLDAMMQAAHDSFPDFRRYLRAKAKALGLPVLAWYDLFAPVNREGHTWPYDQGAQFVIDQFGTYSPKLRRLAEQAFGENWIDAEPRTGKVDGGFCMLLRGGESRILVNYKPV